MAKNLWLVTHCNLHGLCKILHFPNIPAHGADASSQYAQTLPDLSVFPVGFRIDGVGEYPAAEVIFVFSGDE